MKNNIITIQLPNTDRFNSPIDKDIDMTQVGETGGIPPSIFMTTFWLIVQNCFNILVRKLKEV